VEVITGVFAGFTFAMEILFGLRFWIPGPGKESTWGLLQPMFTSTLAFGAVPLGCLGVLVAFYSDWILVAIAENLSGSPSSDNAVVFWIYFAAKRLPFFFL
jgi:hypothetical protein